MSGVWGHSGIIEPMFQSATAEAVEERLKRPRGWNRRNSLPYTLVFLIVAYLGVFILFPIAQQFLTSFSNNVVGVDKVTWVGLRNYERLFEDDDFWFAVQVTFTYMVLVVAGAWLGDRSPERGRAGTFLESVRQVSLASTGDEASRDPEDHDRARLRASVNVDEDEAALDAYNALLSRLNARAAAENEGRRNP